MIHVRLHGRTGNDRARSSALKYFVAKTIGAGVLAELPAGFEIVESINAVVSVRRIDRSETEPGGSQRAKHSISDYLVDQTLPHLKVFSRDGR